MTRWEEDIFSQGAYSYHDSFVTEKDIETVFKSINDKIFFAGEHTDPIYYGSLHAAYNSGIRVLNELGLLLFSEVHIENPTHFNNIVS